MALTNAVNTGFAGVPTWSSYTNQKFVQADRWYLYNNFQNLVNNQKIAQSEYVALSLQVSTLDAKVSNMQPAVITESISFLIGAFTAIAFVVASRMRF